FQNDWLYWSLVFGTFPRVGVLTMALVVGWLSSLSMVACLVRRSISLPRATTSFSIRSYWALSSADKISDLACFSSRMSFACFLTLVCFSCYSIILFIGLSS